MRIKIIGASGKLGRSIAAVIEQESDLELSEEPDLYIDASLPPALAKNLQVSRPIVIGVTGLSPADHELIKKTAEKIPIFYSPNFSLGMALLRKFATMAAKQFPAEINIIETHHTQKKDAPSGSALALSAAMQGGQIQSLRIGNTLGKHEVLFNAPAEELILTHNVLDRAAFARGAIAAARFLIQQPPGLYGMDNLFPNH